MKLKLMTYNISGGQIYETHLQGKPFQDCPRDISHVAEVIKQANADVVGMNEVFHCEAFGDQTAQIAKLAGYTHYFFAPAFYNPALKGHYGNAILSKYPIVQTEIMPIAAETGIRLAEPRVVLQATLNCNGKLLSVLISHFGLIEAEKARAVDAVLAFAKDSGNQCVFMGDLNCTRDSVHTNRLRKVFRASNDGQAELKTWPVEPSPPELCTFHSPLSGRQIDFIFVTDGICVNKTETVYSLASDHKPLYSDIVF